MKLFYKIFTIILIHEVFFTSAVEIPESMKKYAKKLHDKCQEKVGVVEELLKQSRTGHLSDDRTLQCYFHCLLDMVGLIDEKNVVHLEHLKEILPTELHPVIDNFINACGTKHGADGCETAYRTVKCYFEADPMIFKHQFDFMFS